MGIGASAGGLDVFKRFLTAMPHNSGMAFVLIQHLDPNHESLMADLLSKYTAMPVVEIRNATPLEPNKVYMIPPNKYLKMHDSGLFLDQPVKQRGMRMPVDYFFHSLAEARGARAIGVILSGTGSDGTLGAKEIKGAGGMLMAEDPASAEYDGMPKSVISTGLVDFELPIERMADALLRYVQHPYVDGDKSDKQLDQTDPDHFKGILNVLRAYTDYDFRCYKRGTLNRRIQRRMGLRHIHTLEEYLRQLRTDPDEVRSLFRDLLIGVTRFFREKKAWSDLETQVVAKIVANKSLNEPVRIWVPGCASGEEAYSHAILFYEQFVKQGNALDLQIFATDLDERAIEFARASLYPQNIGADVAPRRLKRFFSEKDDRFRVAKHLRESTIFAVQNLVSDPPFSKLDIISCRNLLIYLETDVQAKLMEMFHFALAENGVLFLGSSETVGKRSDL
ncbi:MAG: chemotaxis protein CheB [Bryobacterales bacterium]